MNLDETKRRQVAAWIDEGLKLSDIQKRLEKEWGMVLTYLEVRMLVDDLKLKPKDPPPPVPSPTPALAAPTSKLAGSLPDNDLPMSGVSVNVDQLTRPGYAASGKVKFSDGKTADWFVDQMGRLGLAPAEKGYKPSAADIQDFQTALQTELQRLG